MWNELMYNWNYNSTFIQDILFYVFVTISLGFGILALIANIFTRGDKRA